VCGHDQEKGFRLRKRNQVKSVPDGTSGQASRNAEDELRTADVAWLKVYRAKDLEKSVAFCDEEASMLVPNAPMATGKEAITKMIARGFALKDYELTWQPNRVGVAQSGDLGYTSGTYDFSFKDASGKIVSDKGKYLMVWKKQADGEWKVLLDMNNSDLPAL
jgi:ketosteroid isomerase-like protein